MKRFLYITFFFGLLLLVNCRHKCQDKSNPDCENFDPCTQDHETSADFTITESGRCFDPDIDITDRRVITVETDTTASTVFFNAKYYADVYEWHIGTDTAIRRTKSFSVDFLTGGGNLGHGALEIMLITKRYNPNKKCFPTDEGIDTVKKTLYSLGYNYRPTPICGKYYGSFEHKPDSSFVINIVRGRGIAHLEKMCGFYKDTIVDVAVGNYLISLEETGCNKPMGYGILNKKTRQLVIYYSVIDNNFYRYKRRFIGQQIK